MTLVFSPLNQYIRELFKKAHSKLIIVSPWIKNNALRYILSDNKDIHLQVLTVGNFRDFLSGSSDILAFEWLLREDADVRLVINLHAKIYIADETAAIVTSANLTPSGLEKNLEAGICLTHKTDITELIDVVNSWFLKAKKINNNWLNEIKEKIAQYKETQENIKSLENNIDKVGRNLRGKYIKNTESPKKVQINQEIRLKNIWIEKIKKWRHIKSQPEYAEKFIRFIENAIRNLPPETFKQTRFGVHKKCISLTIGNIWLVSIYKSKIEEMPSVSNQNIWILVDDSWDIPANSTKKCRPLGWKIYSWKYINKIIKEKQIWEAYAKAAEYVLKSPISRLNIPRNIINKERLDNVVDKS
ncbi:MAG: phospholipase D family protein [Promethearchaeota archaeon]